MAKYNTDEVLVYSVTRFKHLEKHINSFKSSGYEIFDVINSSGGYWYIFYGIPNNKIVI